MRPLLWLACLAIGCGGADDVTTSPEDAAASPPDSASSADDTAITIEDSGVDVATDTVSDAIDTDSGPKITPKQRVLDFLTSISGKKTLAGIHNRHNATPSQFTGQMHDITGKYPAFWSADFLFESDDIAHRADIVVQAKTEWSHGAVVQLMFHACPPDIGEPCNWDPGLLHHPLSDPAWKDLVTDGGTLNKAWKARLDVIAPFLKELQDAGVAPLFRPHHEMNQGAFWWGGRPGPEGTRKLYQITHDYLVKTKGLDQLIWVWDVQDLSWDFDQYDPGEAYYDLAALDVYDGSGFTKAKYDAMVKASSRPIAIGECQNLPTAAQLDAQPGWTFFMGWSELVAENNSQGAIKALFDSPRVVTLDEMPGW
ncbi:MAG: glycoside hydrolase family 26 protein [Polyangiales bacterium]